MIIDAVIASMSDNQTTLARLRAAAELAGTMFLIDEMVAEAGPVEDDGDGWRKIYDAVFGGPVGRKVSSLLTQLDTSFPKYCDPDTTYAADASAWIAALRERVDEIMPSFRVDPDMDILISGTRLSDIAGSLRDKEGRGRIAAAMVEATARSLKVLGGDMHRT